MRSSLIALLMVTVAFLACDDASNGSPGGTRAKWHRVFSDDFKRGLDRSSWGRYTGRPGGDPGGWWAPSHAAVRHGILNLETYRDRRFGNRWVSGGVSNARAVKQTYGKYEVRFRVDHGRGVAAILLLWPVGEDWPPEVDFAEDGGASRRRRSMSATLHHGSENHQIQRTVHADFSRWHTAGVEWTPGRLVYTLDRKPWGRVRSRHVPSEPMELAMQAQAGTCGNRYAPCPDSTTPSRVTLQIHWVRIYAYR